MVLLPHDAEVVFEVIVRLVAAALFGFLLGTFCAAILAPVLGFFKASRALIVDSATKVAVVLIVFLLSRYALEVLIGWSYTIAPHRAIYDKLLYTGQFVAIASRALYSAGPTDCNDQFGWLLDSADDTPHSDRHCWQRRSSRIDRVRF